MNNDDTTGDPILEAAFGAIVDYTITLDSADPLPIYQHRYLSVPVVRGFVIDLDCDWEQGALRRLQHGIARCRPRGGVAHTLQADV